MKMHFNVNSWTRIFMQIANENSIEINWIT